MHQTIETDTVLCDCGGKVELKGHGAFLYHGIPTVTHLTILGNPISGCPNVPPCTSVASSDGTYTTKGSLYGHKICLQEKISAGKTDMGRPLKMASTAAANTNWSS